ncbi:MAG: hypothetical protein F4X43_01445 [Acidobacteria bacterium]|nr:hypothetical protein [Acidobacteriota bacterium]
MAVAACGGDGSAPTVAAPQPPAVVVTFVSETVRVEEGETAEIMAQYRTNTLSTPLSLAVSPLNQGAIPEDYELSGNTFDIPAGQNVTGTAAISLTALVDNQVAEGEEVVALRLEPPEGVRAELGPNLEVRIADVGASPCRGVQVVATPTELIESPRSWNGVPGCYRSATLELALERGAQALWIDWEGPFLPDGFWGCGEEPLPAPIINDKPPAFNLAEWTHASLPEGILQTLRVEWPEPGPLTLRFRGVGGACEGSPTLTCAGAGCELNR